MVKEDTVAEALPERSRVNAGGAVVSPSAPEFAALRSKPISPAAPLAFSEPPTPFTLLKKVDPAEPGDTSVAATEALVMVP